MKLIIAVVASGLLTAAEALVLNGDLERADPTAATRPLGWDQPDGLGIQWLTAPGDGHGKALRFDSAISEKRMVAQWKQVDITMWDIPNASDDVVGSTYGLSLYSQAFPIVADQAYKVVLDHRGVGGGKVWVRGYVEKKGRQSRVYEAVAETPPSAEWRTITYVFHPTRAHAKAPGLAVATTMKVMLYAYWPAGESWFDNVRVVPATAEELAAELAR